VSAWPALFAAGLETPASGLKARWAHQILPTAATLVAIAPFRTDGACTPSLLLHGVCRGPDRFGSIIVGMLIQASRLIRPNPLPDADRG
jgi:hypothetical protein